MANDEHQNDYEGNGWSRYQKLVMAQLEGHTKLLESMNAEQNATKQELALSNLLTKTWREEMVAKTTELRNDIDWMYESKEGFDKRLDKLEQVSQVNEKVTLKFKGWWALIGGAVAVLIDLAFNIIQYFVQKP